MPRIILYAAVTAIFFSVSHAEAANTINWTFYGPGAAGWMQGPMTAAANNLEGNNTIRTLDDVRTGKSKYVTLASATIMRGRFYCIGTVTYTSPPNNGGDGKTHTLTNVVGYVHDTGCAFNGTCSCSKLPQFCNGKPRPDKMDIPVGNFNGSSAEFAMNYITKNPNRAPASWTQIAGLPQADAQPSSSNPCGGTTKEEGTPTAAPYTPPQSAAPQNPLTTGPSGYPTAPQPQPISQPTQMPGQAGTQPYMQQSPIPTGGSSAYPYPTQASYAAPQPAISNPLAGVPVPQPAATSMLTTLFQNAPATSGIRVIQTAAQQLVDIFSHSTSTGMPNSTGVSQSVTIQNASDVSFMTLSQIDAAQDVIPAQAAVPQAGRTAAADMQRTQAETPRPESTFAESNGVVQVSAQSTSSLGVVSLVLNSLASILRSIISVFGGR